MKKEKKNALPFWKNPRFRYGSLSTAILCVGLAVLLALTMLTDSLEKRYGWRVDMSFNALTTQSEATLAVLDGLAHPVHIYALYNRGQEDLPLLELLNRYAAASDKVTWEKLDVSLNPGLISRFTDTASDDTVQNDSLIVYCEETNRYKVLDYTDFLSLSFDTEAGGYTYSGLTYEKSLTSAISYVAQEVIPRVMILQGHGELDEGTTQVLANLLAASNYEVSYFTLDTAETTLTPDDLLLILSPQIDLMDHELKQIVDFAAGGGSIFFTVDYADPTAKMTNFASLMRSYGFIHQPGMVIASPEEPATYYNNNRIYLIPSMIPTEITASLVSAKTDTLLLTGCGAFETPEETTDRALQVSTVLASGNKAYLHDVSDGKLERGSQDPVGPFALALQAQRLTDAGYLSKAFVLGSSTLLTSSDVYAMTNSQEFILRVVQYLRGDEPVSLGIMAKAAVRPGLSAGSVTLGSILIVALPLMVLAAAVVVLGTRKNK